MTRPCIAAIVVLASLAGCPLTGPNPSLRDPAVMLVFHNNSGPMCLEALGRIAQWRVQYAALQVEEHLTTEPAETALLARLRAEFPRSIGVSDQFAYLPIIFYQDQAFSGFDEQVATALEALVERANTTPP